MSPIVLFLICAVLLLGAIYGVWRYWENLAHVSAEEEAFDARVAALNERQATRLSEDQLTHPPNEDDAWSLMVNRGRGRGRGDRYGGELARRVGERRRRTP